MRKLIPIILVILGVAGGVGAGLMLRPAPSVTPETATDATGEIPAAAEPSSHEPAQEPAKPKEGDVSAPSAIEYIALRRQLIVPLVEDNRVGALMVLSLSIEANSGNIELIYDREPKLRDEFLQVLFRHANTGGFDGMFTSGESMSDLKSALNAAATEVLGAISRQVLVTEILRQEI